MKEVQNLEVGKTYKLIFKVGEEILYFTGEIVSNGEFITFIDKFGETNGFAKECFLSFKRV